MYYLQKCVPKETTDRYVKAFNIITNKDEAKAMTEHISSGCRCKFNSTTCYSKHVNVNIKIIISTKKIIVGILAHVFVRIVKIKKLLLILQ